MSDDSCEEDCTVFIEEIKSDNAAQRIAAVEKVHKIGEVLGPARIREELVPYLVDIVREMDNEELFLVKLCHQFVLLRDYAGGIEHSHFILEPLEMLASLDQPPVRERAVAALVEFIKGQRAQFFSERFYPLVLKLAGSESTPPKLSGVALMHVVYPRVDEEKKAALRTLFLKLSEDEIPLVRRAVAEHLVRLSEVVPMEWAKASLIELWRKLATDSFDMVRVKAFESACDLAIFLSKEECEARIFSLLQGLDLGAVSWQVRYTLCETVTLLIDKLSPKTVRQQVAQLFESLLNDSECEVKSISLLKLPELCSKLDS